MIIHLVLEGYLEEPVAEKILRCCGHEKGAVYGKKGCAFIKSDARKYVRLAQHGCGVLILTDFRDSGEQCPSEAHKAYTRDNSQTVPPNAFLCRFAVMELESWLLADRNSIADLLHVPVHRIPGHPDAIPRPKRKIVDIARHSRNNAVRDALIPPRHHGGSVGPGYQAMMMEYARNQWNPEKAAKYSPSLERCLLRLRKL